MSHPLDWLAPYQRNSVTSLEASLSIEPKAGTLRARVLTFLRDRGAWGATDQEMQSALNMDPSTQRPRRIELAHAGLIVESGTRETRAGRQAVVWIAL